MECCPFKIHHFFIRTNHLYCNKHLGCRKYDSFVIIVSSKHTAIRSNTSVQMHCAIYFTFMCRYFELDDFMRLVSVASIGCRFYMRLVTVGWKPC